MSRIPNPIDVARARMAHLDRMRSLADIGIAASNLARSIEGSTQALRRFRIVQAYVMEPHMSRAKRKRQQVGAGQGRPSTAPKDVAALRNRRLLWRTFPAVAFYHELQRGKR